jgi:hypothetical protein
MAKIKTRTSSIKKKFRFSPNEKEISVKGRKIGLVYKMGVRYAGYPEEWGYWSYLGDIGAEGYDDEASALEDLKIDHFERISFMKRDYTILRGKIVKWIGRGKL